jgi:phospholipid/cholesterol/gamma-HCH transport system substrate-binding protein
LENKNEILVGALTVVGIVVFILGFKYLQGDDIFTRSKLVNVVADRTSNITPSSAVLENGVPIGRVDEIILSESPRYLHRAILTLKLDKNVRVPKDSRFVIYGVDNLGKMAIGLVRGKGNDDATPKDTLECLVKGDPIAQISDLAATLAPRLDSTLASIQYLAANLNAQLGTGENSLLKTAVTDLSATLHSVNKVAASADQLMLTLNNTIGSNKSNIDGILKNVNELTAKFNGEMGKLDSLLSNFQTISSQVAKGDLQATIVSARETLEGLKATFKLINEGDGTISKLLKDDGAYNDITRTLQSLNAVLTDLKANPKKYISLSLIDRSRTITVTDTSVQQFLEKNPKAAKALK